MIFNKKIVIVGIVGFSVVTARIVTLIVILNKKEYKKESKVVVDTSSLRASSYEVTGLNGAGTLAKKDVVSLPPQVIAKYAKSSSPPSSDSEYSLTLPTSLANDDKVFIKFFIKLAHTASHKFPTTPFTNPIEFGVTGLEAIPVSSSDLSVAIAMFNDFSSTDTGDGGAHDFTSLLAGRADVIDKFIAIASYNAPSLETGVSINKVIIKTAYSSATNQVVFTIALQKEGAAGVTNNLKDVTVTFAKITINTSSLSTSSYEVTGFNGGGVFAKKSVVSLPLQVEVKYAKGSSPPISGEYSLTLPTALANDDKVFIKFFIKSAYTASHKFPTAFTNLVEFRVTGLATSSVPATDLSVAIVMFNDFSSTDTVTSGRNDFRSLSAGTADVKTKFIAIARYNAPSLEASVSISKVIIKIAYSHATNQVVFTITLQKEGAASVTNNSKDVTVTFAKTIDKSSLRALSYEVTWDSGVGRLVKKSDVSFPPQVIAKYAKSSSPPSSDSKYSLTLPTNLANGDSIYIKFFIKSTYVISHKIPIVFTNPIEFGVVGPSSILRF